MQRGDHGGQFTCHLSRTLKTIIWSFYCYIRHTYTVSGLAWALLWWIPCTLAFLLETLEDIEEDAACREFPWVGSTRSGKHKVPVKCQPLYEYWVLVCEPKAAGDRVFRCLHRPHASLEGLANRPAAVEWGTLSILCSWILKLCKSTAFKETVYHEEWYEAADLHEKWLVWRQLWYSPKSAAIIVWCNKGTLCQKAQQNFLAEATWTVLSLLAPYSCLLFSVLLLEPNYKRRKSWAIVMLHRWLWLSWLAKNTGSQWLSAF